ncbi:MAG TPA: hypothetical protein VHX12_12285 [Acidisoma sp.]|jgi:hypothetical protein|nr:hypothetical protein [Acidisoma sp.]
MHQDGSLRLAQTARSQHRVIELRDTARGFAQDSVVASIVVAQSQIFVVRFPNWGHLFPQRSCSSSFADGTGIGHSLRNYGLYVSILPDAEKWI